MKGMTGMSDVRIETETGYINCTIRIHRIQNRGNVN